MHGEVQSRCVAYCRIFFHFFFFTFSLRFFIVSASRRPRGPVLWWGVGSGFWAQRAGLTGEVISRTGKKFPEGKEGTSDCFGGSGKFFMHFQQIPRQEHHKSTANLNSLERVAARVEGEK